MDLAEETYEMVRQVEPASSVIKAARSNLVSRLNSYASEYTELFATAIELVNADFMHIIKRQALGGRAIIRSNSPLLEQGIVVNMVLDLLAERGFSVVLDVVRTRVPTHMDPQVQGNTAGARIISRTEKNFVFHIQFPKPQIIRND